MKDHRLWERRYNELKEYKKVNGDTNVPRRYEPNPQLGVWVSNQRQYYKKFKTGISGWGMTDIRIKRLEKIGFEWVLSGGRNIYAHTGRTSAVIAFEWDSMYDRLVEYKQLFGDVNVPKSFDEDKVLADWVRQQKQGFRRFECRTKSKDMTEERYNLLLKLGFQDIILSDDEFTDDNNDSSDSDLGSSQAKIELKTQSIENGADLKSFHSKGRNAMVTYGHTNSKSVRHQKTMKERLVGEVEIKEEKDSYDEVNEDTIFFDAVASCGNVATLDSIAEIILKKYSAKED